MADTVHPSELHRVVVQCIVYVEPRWFWQPRLYFLMKRSEERKQWPGLWTIPGGGLEPKDYLKHLKRKPESVGVLGRALRREVREETRMQLKRLHYVSSSAFVRPLDNIGVIAVRFMAECHRGDIVLEENDSTEYKWVTAAEICRYEIIGTIANDIRCIEAARPWNRSLRALRRALKK
ncbi:NUDIX domain-containing protein [Candidatus Kaiserbacteria bacterium]|nr:NUDIX domain-containing protein [Candidatus Kaiserbacteria bacterium]